MVMSPVVVVSGTWTSIVPAVSARLAIDSLVKVELCLNVNVSLPVPLSEKPRRRQRGWHRSHSR